ncbi:MAG: DNA primase [Patescibacteria group bacterium]
MASPVEQIKSRLNIVDVVQGYLRLQKAGVNFKALCPFHREKSPSFFVSPSRDSWHCFGCNRGGDIFSFVMEIERVEFPEALKILADRVGVEIEPLSPQYKSEKIKINQVLEEAKNFYRNELNNNKDVYKYLQGRGLNDEVINSFQLGYALGPPNAGWRNLYNVLKSKNYSDAELEKSGMVIRSEKGYYDRFRNRIMFPINNISGQTAGFSGRIFGEESEKTGGKYINTPQTLIYDKSKILFGLDKAKEEIRKKDFCIIVEGNMDAIMSHQAGFKNTVAVSGTALTIDQVRMIKRLTNSLAIAFDRDDAGFNASKKGVNLALKEGMEVKIIEIPKGKDPADAVKEDKEGWGKSVDKAEHIIDFLLKYFMEKEKSSRELQKKIRINVLPYVKFLDNEMEKAQWVKKIAKILAIKEEPIWDEIKKISKELNDEENDNDNTLTEIKTNRTRFDFLKEKVIGFALWQENCDDVDFKNLLEEATEKYGIDLGKIKDRDRLILSIEIFYSNLENKTEEFRNLLEELEKEDIKSQLEDLAEAIRKMEISGEEENIREYISKFHLLSKKLNELK